MLFALISLLFTIGFVIYLWIQKRSKYFENFGIEYDKSLPIGSFKNVIYKQENFFDAVETLYNKFNSG